MSHQDNSNDNTVEEMPCELELELELACGDIVSAAQFTPAMEQLLRKEAPGLWVSVPKLVPADHVYDGAFVTWLPLPDNTEQDFVLIIFLHEPSGWTMTATYNRALILSRPSGQSQDPARQ